MKTRYSRIAQADIRDAKAFYSGGSDPTGGAAFAAAFKRVMREIREYPQIGAPYELGSRRFVMAWYPYAIIYTPSNEGIFVIAVSHHSRKPGYWHGAVGSD